MSESNTQIPFSGVICQRYSTVSPRASAIGSVAWSSVSSTHILSAAFLGHNWVARAHAGHPAGATPQEAWQAMWSAMSEKQEHRNYLSMHNCTEGMHWRKMPGKHKQGIDCCEARKCSGWTRKLMLERDTIILKLSSYILLLHKSIINFKISLMRFNFRK